MLANEYAGIYYIKNGITGHVYIGGSIQIRRRLRTHRTLLRSNRHTNFLLQKSWNEHGENNFIIEPLLVCSKDNVLFYEQRALQGFKSCDPKFGYNIQPTAGSWVGCQHKDETRKKISLGRTGWCHTDEARAKMAACARGRKHSPESRALLSLKLKGLKRSDETKKKIALAKMGHSVSAEARVKIGAASKGRKHDAASRAKMSAAKKGVKFSAAHRQAMTESLRLRWLPGGDLREMAATKKHPLIAPHSRALPTT